MAALAVLAAALNTTTSLFNGTNLNSTALIPLAFTAPVITQNVTQMRYDIGQQVNVSWITPFEHTTVEVWQGPSADGTFVTQILGANLTREMSMLMWEAGPINNASLDSGFHFRLQKGHTPNTCDRCWADGVTFRVRDPNAVSTTSTSSQSSTSMPTSSPTTSAAASSSGSGLSEDAKLGIGLGVGLGVAALLAILGLLLFCLRRRKRQRQERELADKAEKQEQLRYSSGGDSALTGNSRQPLAAHPRFDFEDQNGRPKEGWQSLFHRFFGQR